MIVGTEQLANILGVTARRVQQMTKDGMPKSGRGKYDLAVCVQWYVARMTERAAETEKGDLLEERTALTREQRIKTELENQRIREELVQMSDVANVLNEIAVIISSQLDGIGGRLAGQLSGMSEPAEIQNLLFDEMREVRANIGITIDGFANSEVSSDSGLDNNAAA